MEEGATYYRMQARPAPSTHGAMPSQVSQQSHPQQQQQGQSRLNKHSMEYQERKACYQQFPMEWKKEISDEKDANRRLAKFEEFRKRLHGEKQQPQTQGRQIQTNRGPIPVMTRNRNPTEIAMQQQQVQQQGGGEGYSQNQQQVLFPRRQGVVSSDPNRASPVNGGPVRMAPQGVVRGPGGARLLPARGPNGTPQLVRRLLAPVASAGGEDQPAVKRAKLTPSPPGQQQQQGYGSQQVYVKQEPREGQQGPQQGQQQVVYVSQGQRVQSPNGTIYIQQQQPDGTVVLVPAQKPRQQLVYVRASDVQQGVRRAAGGSPASPAEGGGNGGPPSKSPPVLQQHQIQQHQPYQQGTSGQQQTRIENQQQQQYLQPSGGNPMHKSSSLPVFTNSQSQMPVSPQVTAMRSPAPPNYGGPQSPLVQQQPQQMTSQMTSQQQMPQQQMTSQQMVQGPPELQPHYLKGSPQWIAQQQQLQQQQAARAPKATAEYKEKLEKLRKRLLEDMQRILRRYRIDDVKPPQEFDTVMQVLMMRRVIAIEKLDQVARMGAKLVETNKLTWPLTEQLREIAKAGMKLQEGDLMVADPWHQVRDKFLTLPPEVLKAIS